MLNLLLIANSSIPRGGHIHFELDDNGTRFIFKVSGKMLRIPPKFAQLCNASLSEDIDAHTIQPYYTLLLADLTKRTIDIQADELEIIYQVS